MQNLLTLALAALAFAGPVHAQNLVDRLSPPVGYDSFADSLEHHDGKLYVHGVRTPGVDVILVYGRADSGWSVESTLTLPPLATSNPVEILVEGSLLVASQWTTHAGQCTVFERRGRDWHRLQVLTVPRPVSFGKSTLLVGDRLFVGAGGTSDQPSSLFVFRRSLEGFELERECVGPAPYFGHSLAANGEHLIAAGGEDYGGLLFFDLETLEVVQRISGDLGFLGAALHVEGNRLVSHDLRFVRIYEFDGRWRQVGRIEPKTGGWISTVVVEGERIAVGMSNEHITMTDTILVYEERAGRTWSLEAAVWDPAGASWIGQTFDVTGNEIYCGTRWESGLVPVLVFDLEAEPLGVHGCFAVDCPCGDDPTGGCPVRDGMGSRIAATGSTSHANDDLRIWGTRMVYSTHAILFAGNGWEEQPFALGRLCIGGGVLVPLATGEPDHEGVVSVPFSSTAELDLFPPGSTWHFQWYYGFNEDDYGVDPLCTTGFTLSHALTLTFEP